MKESQRVVVLNPINMGRFLTTVFCSILLLLLPVQVLRTLADESGGNLPAVKVMTFNLHRGRDQNGTNQLAGSLALFNTERPDLIALQEVDQDQVKIFLSAGYQVIYGPNLNLFPFHYGNMFLTRRRVLYHRHHYLPSELELRGLDEIALEIEGHKVTFLNTHLGLNKTERMNQFTEINRIINYLSGPIILMGDFNSEPDDKLFAEFAVRFRECGGVFPGTKTFPASNPKKRLDQIWYNDYWGFVGGSTIPWLGSDHLPSLAELKLIKPNPASMTGPLIPVIPGEYQAWLMELDQPRIKWGVEAESEPGLNRGAAEVLFPLSSHWVLGAEFREESERVFRVGYTPGLFDLRDYLSQLRIRGYGRWLFSVCMQPEEPGWLEWEQLYRWNRRWETQLTLAVKAPEPEWELLQGYYLSEALSLSLGIGAGNNLSANVTLSLP